RRPAPRPAADTPPELDLSQLPRAVFRPDEGLALLPWTSERGPATSGGFARKSQIEGEGPCRLASRRMSHPVRCRQAGPRRFAARRIVRLRWRVARRLAETFSPAGTTVPFFRRLAQDPAQSAHSRSRTLVGKARPPQGCLRAITRELPRSTPRGAVAERIR